MAFVNSFSPRMTSANTPSPRVVSTSVVYHAGWELYYAGWKSLASFTHNNSNWLFLNADFPAWIKTDFGSTTSISGYTIARNEFHADCNPTAWTFDGSDDDSAWTVLDTQSSITPTNEIQVYPLSTVSYRYYRLSVTANNGHAYYGGCGDIRFIAPDGGGLLRVGMSGGMNG